MPNEPYVYETVLDMCSVDFTGHWQPGAIFRAMQEAGASVPMFGLAKRFEEIYLPGREDPIVLDRRSNALHLVQYVRDEAHRFGITHHRALRGKEGRHPRRRPQEAGGADTALPERKGHF